MITLRLPVPPSANNLFANMKGEGRHRTKKYMAWIDDAGWHLKAQRPGRITGRYSLSIVLPVRTRGDIDNRIKSISDLIVSHGVVQDDSLAWSVSIRRDDDATEALVTVEAT